MARVYFVGDAKNPEKVWPAVAEALPFDERPEGWDVTMVFDFFGTTQIILDKQDGEMAMLYTFPNAEGLNELFDPESMANNMAMLSIEDAELGEIEVQGRTVRALRFNAPAPGTDKVVPSLRVDLTGDGNEYICYQVFMQRSQEAVTDEVVQGMLEPFDVWRGK